MLEFLLSNVTKKLKEAKIQYIYIEAKNGCDNKSNNKKRPRDLQATNCATKAK